MTFQHISGEYFLIFVRWFSTEARNEPDDLEPGTDGITKAEFRLGEDGHVKEMGVLLEPEMGGDKIWFKKAGPENRYTADSSADRRKSSHGASSTREQRRLFSSSGQTMAPLFA